MVRGCLSEITHFPQSYISETGLLVTTAKPSCSHSGHDGFSVFIYQQGKNNHYGYQTHRQLQQTPRTAGIFLPPVRSLHRNRNHPHIRTGFRNRTPLRLPSGCRRCPDSTSRIRPQRTLRHTGYTKASSRGFLLADDTCIIRETNASCRRFWWPY